MRRLPRALPIPVFQPRLRKVKNKATTRAIGNA